MQENFTWIKRNSYITNDGKDIYFIVPPSDILEFAECVDKISKETVGQLKVRGSDFKSLQTPGKQVVTKIPGSYTKPLSDFLDLVGGGPSWGW